ncbi:MULTISPECIES: hypothetical protein [Streptomycetaceae]|uniref:Uncharacterized protein n=1 Tax=Streptantibioticus cattleyicolor (strain ATCC 35852 / DSM 46488 / JCM 4925 / NBRC 14057 / NRRL 8057) TaxID=1003195 RepID=F8JYA2_STREN|nr:MULTISPECIES: hypothetical protein [Streptomycetaceae]AEW95895.1 hypothetical protein SCATT_35240 [Streptantibioticus cattleyicolor NRRL 8057 = DSM 46488]MYS60434.1 hypothetical protein [Streptomyces sp. SID5468]CCB76232.1 protein of unknown function [Streptantibioticus cattleyicolor NRRL 8057 = DSM 46488]
MTGYFDGYDGPWPDDDWDDDYAQESEEWAEGTCDHCLNPDQIGPLGTVCACRIGQGAAPEDCVCGPDADSEGAA